MSLVEWHLPGKGHKVDELDFLPIAQLVPAHALKHGQKIPDRKRAAQRLMIDRIEPDTIAEYLGLRAGELLVLLNDRGLREKQDIQRILAERSPGGDVRARVIDAYGRERARTWPCGSIRINSSIVADRATTSASTSSSAAMPPANAVNSAVFSARKSSTSDAYSRAVVPRFSSNNPATTSRLDQ